MLYKLVGLTVEVVPFLLLLIEKILFEAPGYTVVHRSSRKIRNYRKESAENFGSGLARGHIDCIRGQNHVPALGTPRAGG